MELTAKVSLRCANRSFVQHDQYWFQLYMPWLNSRCITVQS